MTFFAFGLNHERAPVRVREAFALDAQARRSVYETSGLSEEAELVVISTCNRTEVYLYGTPTDVDRVRGRVAACAGDAWPAGMDFCLQDKEAYREAVEADRVITVLHRLLHAAFRAAKRIIRETALTSGAASISSAAVAAARAFFEVRYPDGLTGRRVLLLGAGQMGVLALEALQQEQLAELRRVAGAVDMHPDRLHVHARDLVEVGHRQRAAVADDAAAADAGAPVSAKLAAVAARTSDLMRFIWSASR